MSFFAELRRRNVVRVGLAYIVIGWILAQVAEFAFENFGAPDWVLKTFVAVAYRQNDWGLYDVSGNVWEWTQDWHDEDYYETSPKQDPSGPDTGEDRVFRGGSWKSGTGTVLRLSLRNKDKPGTRVHGQLARG